MAGDGESRRRPQTTEDVDVSSLLRGLQTGLEQKSPTRERPDGVPAAGEVIAGKYVVEELLGAGGMGVVLAARHVHIGQRVAIKFLQGKAAKDKNAVGRFLREARAAATLASEHVARVFDFGTLETGEPYLVMEYLAGVDLGRILRKGPPMSVADVVDAVLQASEAVAEAHARGIVHRDLKPSNLFVTRGIDGAPLVKVLDFGISKIGDAGAADQSLTASGQVMGSPQYMSPEQVRNAKDVDGRTDVWSLGVILYELLTRVRPFAGDALGATLAKILTEAPTPVGELRSDLPPGLANAIAQCLERDLERRVQSVAELASKLLPFAPPRGALAVERILRVSGTRTDAVAKADEPMSAAVPPPSVAPLPPAAVTEETSAVPEGGATEPPWFKSGLALRRRTSRVAVFVLVGVAGALLVVASVATFRASPSPSPALDANGSAPVQATRSSSTQDVPSSSSPAFPPRATFDAPSVPIPPTPSTSASPQPVPPPAPAGLASAAQSRTIPPVVKRAISAARAMHAIKRTRHATMRAYV
jgi:serine/threonine-protein kinase